MRRLVRVLAIVLIVLGLLAAAHFVCLLCRHPLVRLAEIAGDSMAPTLVEGDRVLFIRRPWQLRDIVLADVHEDAPVVKRILDIADSKLFLQGDNTEVSETYWITPDQIQGIMLGQIPFKLPCCIAQ